MVAKDIQPNLGDPDDFSIDPQRMRVVRNGLAIDLTPTEFKILMALVRRRGHVVSHRDLVTEVWGIADSRYRPNLKLYISYLRAKVERERSQPQLILTKHGVGYIFADPCDRDGDGASCYHID